MRPRRHVTRPRPCPPGSVSVRRSAGRAGGPRVRPRRFIRWSLGYRHRCGGRNPGRPGCSGKGVLRRRSGRTPIGDRLAWWGRSELVLIPEWHRRRTRRSGRTGVAAGVERAGSRHRGSPCVAPGRYGVRAPAVGILPVVSGSGADARQLEGGRALSFRPCDAASSAAHSIHPTSPISSAAKPPIGSWGSTSSPSSRPDHPGRRQDGGFLIRRTDGR